MGLALLAASCSDPLVEVPIAPALDEIPPRVEAPDRSWIDAHFAAPIAAQGPAPDGWSPIEASLRSADCGACHPSQYAEWSGSRHAAAVGPGLLGQAHPDQDACLDCHAPLAEQREDPALRAEGVGCAACHVRGHARVSPDGAPAEAGGQRAPHGGATAQPALSDSAFCSPCHDFPAHGPALNGKPLQDTWAEWARTGAAADGQTCQTCHMPSGSHAFPGIHDLDFVAAALGAELTLDAPGGLLRPIRAQLELTNLGAAHRLPTYTTPEILLVVEQRDASGAAIDGTAQRALVARSLSPDLSRELLDSRLMPGESARLDYSQPRSRGAASLAVRIEVWPDEAYRRLYTARLQDPEVDGEAQDLLARALAESWRSRFTAWEQITPLP